jgi:hypothetical protein
LKLQKKLILVKIKLSNKNLTLSLTRKAKGMKQAHRKFLLVLMLLNSFSPLARADALDNWTAGQVNTNTTTSGIRAFSLASIAYGNGRYVAVGSHTGSDFGIIQTSEDGKNWTICGDGDAQFPSMIYDLYNVTYGNGTFVAVGWDYFGGQNLYSSTNGINWASHTNADVSNFYGVTYGGGLFVAVGDGVTPWTSISTNRNIYTSPDGIVWTRRNSGAPAGSVHSIMAVTYGAGRYVAIDDSGYIYTSTLGTTWTRNLISGNSSISSYGYVNFCNGLFMALVNTGTNLTSTDGLSWSPMAKDVTNVFSRVIYANGIYVALSGANVFTSMNGTNWFQRSLHTPTNANLTEIAFGDRKVMAVGYTYPPLPMVPVVYISDPFVGAGMNSGFPPQLKISGLQGRSYRIESTDLLPVDPGNWRTNTTLLLTNSPCIWTDIAASNSQRYYRAVLLP